MTKPDVRKGMPPRKFDRNSFEQRFLSRFADPAFKSLQGQLQEIAAAAWDAYADGRKSPLTRKAGTGFADPDYEIATEWLQASGAIAEAEERRADPSSPSRILLINGSSRTERFGPGEMFEN
jgi:hypothetical protein